jgi:cytochrome P450 PksS
MTVTAKYDVLAPQVRWNPYPVYALLREEMPVYKTPYFEMGANPWLLTRYDDCVTLQKDPRFTKSFERLAGGRMTEEQNMAAAINRHMLFSDPPDHTRLRSLVHKAFTPRMINEMNDRVQAIADDLIDRLDGVREFDLISQYAFPLPIIVISELLGIPHEDRDTFRRWSQIMVMEGARGGDRDLVATAALEFIMYFHQMFDERRANPKDDLISGLVQVEEQGDRLDQQELISMIFLLLVAGHETTVNLIGNGMLTLLQHPDAMQELRADPLLIKTAVEEMLRYESPVSATTMRWALEDIEWHGQVIPRGDLVLASLASANRDPSVFENPDTFDIHRNPNRHMAFGQGIHYCLGAPLARMEGAIAINTLLRRLPNLELTVDAHDVQWNESLLLRGLKELPLRAS